MPTWNGIACLVLKTKVWQTQVIYEDGSPPHVNKEHRSPYTHTYTHTCISTHTYKHTCAQ